LLWQPDTPAARPPEEDRTMDDATTDDTVLRLRIRGRVQGVGYRASLAAEARALGITGWVRNRSDGSVEAVVAGPAEGIDRIVAWARRGPPAARVSEVEISLAAGRFEAFEQRPSH
jgi:acylphosphatase